MKGIEIAGAVINSTNSAVKLQDIWREADFEDLLRAIVVIFKINVFFKNTNVR